MIYTVTAFITVADGDASIDFMKRTFDAEETARHPHGPDGFVAGVRIGDSDLLVIGGEHASPDLRSFSLIASTACDGSTIRTVGIIGPTRMHYSRAISVVDGVTQAVARVLRAN